MCVVRRSFFGVAGLQPSYHGNGSRASKFVTGRISGGWFSGNFFKAALVAVLFLSYIMTQALSAPSANDFVRVISLLRFCRFFLIFQCPPRSSIIGFRHAVKGQHISILSVLRIGTMRHSAWIYLLILVVVGGLATSGAYGSESRLQADKGAGSPVSPIILSVSSPGAAGQKACPDQSLSAIFPPLSRADSWQYTLGLLLMPKEKWSFHVGFVFEPQDAQQFRVIGDPRNALSCTALTAAIDIRITENTHINLAYGRMLKGNGAPSDSSASLPFNANALSELWDNKHVDLATAQLSIHF
jgi:hypothetical protein